MHTVYLGLGSNLGDKCKHVRQAIELLQDHPKIRVTGVSSLYETEPVGYLKQDLFINCVIGIETSLAPYTLLDACQQVERTLKRQRDIRWGPRTIDVDILLYDALHLKDPRLTLPHPRMAERAFVLIPLNELDEDLRINGKTLGELLAKLSRKGVRKIDSGFENPHPSARSATKSLHKQPVKSEI